LQGTAFHRGGQIDTDSSNMLMVFNGGAGIVFKQKFENAVFKSNATGCDVVSVLLRIPNSGYLPYKNGHGFMGNVSATSHNLTFMVSYWNAN
jgi:hypothetical protein